MWRRGISLSIAIGQTFEIVATPTDELKHKNGFTNEITVENLNLHRRIKELEEQLLTTEGLRWPDTEKPLADARGSEGRPGERWAELADRPKGLIHPG